MDCQSAIRVIKTEKLRSAEEVEIFGSFSSSTMLRGRNSCGIYKNVSLKWVLAGATWNVNPGYNTCLGSPAKEFRAKTARSKQQTSKPPAFQLADSCMCSPGRKSLFSVRQSETGESLENEFDR